jgi:KipI family sensor histidine kinase inhibitor
VVEVHTATTYLVYMLGFTPGFPFLGGLSPRIFAPRLDTPRTVVPAGSVGIANGQTGVYPIESPGGWRIIGRTALRLYDPARPAPIMLRPGDHVRFTPASETEYHALAAAQGGSGR